MWRTWPLGRDWGENLPVRLSCLMVGVESYSMDTNFYYTLICELWLWPWQWHWSDFIAYPKDKSSSESKMPVKIQPKHEFWLHANCDTDLETMSIRQLVKYHPNKWKVTVRTWILLSCTMGPWRYDIVSKSWPSLGWWREKERDLTQSYDESPFTKRKFNNQYTTQKRHQKRRLHNDCGPA